MVDVITMTKYDTTEYKMKGCTVRVHRPILSEEEYKSRENEVKKALREFGKEMLKSKGVY